MWDLTSEPMIPKNSHHQLETKSTENDGILMMDFEYI